MSEPTKCIIEVTAGVIPGNPNEALTKRWSLTAEQCRDEDIYASAVGAAMVYALSLQMPGSNNWVKNEWIWL